MSIRTWRCAAVVQQKCSLSWVDSDDWAGRHSSSTFTEIKKNIEIGFDVLEIFMDFWKLHSRDCVVKHTTKPQMQRCLGWWGVKTPSVFTFTWLFPFNVTLNSEWQILQYSDKHVKKIPPTHLNRKKLFRNAPYLPRVLTYAHEQTGNVPSKLIAAIKTQTNTKPC